MPELLWSENLLFSEFSFMMCEAFYVEIKNMAQNKSFKNLKLIWEFQFELGENLSRSRNGSDLEEVKLENCREIIFCI